MESLKEIERLINQHSDVEPLIFQKFVNEELPTCDLESRSLDQLFITIGVALGVYEDEVLDISLPPSVEMVVVETEPNYKGDTASGGGKPATTDTGLVVQVPSFVAVGERIRVDTTNGKYITRI